MLFLRGAARPAVVLAMMLHAGELADGERAPSSSRARAGGADRPRSRLCVIAGSTLADDASDRPVFATRNCSPTDRPRRRRDDHRYLKASEARCEPPRSASSAARWRGAAPPTRRRSRTATGAVAVNAVARGYEQPGESGAREAGGRLGGRAPARRAGRASTSSATRARPEARRASRRRRGPARGVKRRYDRRTSPPLQHPARGRHRPRAAPRRRAADRVEERRERAQQAEGDQEGRLAAGACERGDRAAPPASGTGVGGEEDRDRGRRDARARLPRRGR